MTFPRARRSLYWLFFFLLTLINIIGGIVALNAGSPTARWIIVAVTGLIWLAVAAARARDMNRSPWWALLTPIPVLGFGVAIWLGFSDSQPAESEDSASE